MITEKDTKTMHRGANAFLARDHFKMVLVEKRENIIRDLCNLYRSEKLELAILSGKIGALTLIEDTLKGFDRDVERAHQTEEKINVHTDPNNR